MRGHKPRQGIHAGSSSEAAVALTLVGDCGMATLKSATSQGAGLYAGSAQHSALSERASHTSQGSRRLGRKTCGPACPDECPAPWVQARQGAHPHLRLSLAAQGHWGPARGGW